MTDQVSCFPEKNFLSPNYLDIQSFPNEILHKITCLLGLPDIKNIRLVCRRWRDLLLYYCPKTVKFVPTLSDSTVNYLHSVHVPFDTLKIFDLTKADLTSPPTNQQNQNREEEEETSSLWSPTIRKFHFHQAQQMVLGNEWSKPLIEKYDSVSTSNFCSLMRGHQRSLEHIIFQRNALWGLNSLAGVYGLTMENVTVLEITDFILCKYEMSGWENGTNILLELGKINFPQLQKLVVDVYCEIAKWQALRWHYNFFTFLIKYKKSLKSLYWRQGLQVYDSGCLDIDCTVLNTEPSPMSLEEMTFLRDELQGMKLKEINGGVKPELLSNGFGTLAYHLLSNQTELLRLGLESNPIGGVERKSVPPDYYHRISRVILQNCTTLLSFQIPELDFMPYSERGADFDEIYILWSALSNCKSLESINVAFDCHRGIVLSSLPKPNIPWLKQLTIFGMFCPSILTNIRESCPQLETLHLTSVGWNSDDGQFYEGLRDQFFDAIKIFSVEAKMLKRGKFELELDEWTKDVNNIFQNMSHVKLDTGNGIECGMITIVVENGK